MTDIKAWLELQGFGHLAGTFEANEVGLDVLPLLNDADLKELGVAALGARKRLLKAIADQGLVAPPAAMAPAAPAVAPAEVAAPPPAPERRHLTVMFSDLVDSTRMATALDPEEYQAIIRAYHQTVSDAVRPFEGYVAQLLGDGVLVYFGYPRAHEDAASRAVRAALQVVKAVAAMPSAGAFTLQTRLGIATGTVVFGELGAGTAAAETSASGETPNLAARLQGLALPGDVVLADNTRRLLDQSFELASLGTPALKGFSTPIEVWKVLAERSVDSRFAASQAHSLLDFVGRDSELALMEECWQRVRERDGQVVLLSGEAGIGKSRVCEMLKNRIAPEAPHIVQMQCSPYFGSSALYPVVQFLERLLSRPGSETPALTRAQKLQRAVGSHLAPPAAAALARLAGVAAPVEAELNVEGPAGAAPADEKSQVLQALVDLLLSASRQTPVLFLLEDAHWADPTTEELLALMAQRLRDAACLVVVTSRPEYKPSWSHVPHLTRVSLSRLAQRQCAALVQAASGGKPLPPELVAEIVRKTDGIPLFVEELTRTVIQSGMLRETATGYQLKAPMLTLAIPSTLQDSLMARLDRLSPAKEVAQAGAAIGREFPHALLAQVVLMPREALDAVLAQLLESGLVSRGLDRGEVVYAFKHALIRDTAYNSMVRSQRALHHGRIAHALQVSQPDLAATQPELLAYHCQAAGDAARAFWFWDAASQLALKRSAAREAVMHCRHALALLPGLAERNAGTAELELELDLQMRLGHALFQTEGYSPEGTAPCFARARELALLAEQPDTYVKACHGAVIAHHVAGQYQAVAEMYARVDRARLSPMSAVGMFNALGSAQLPMGRLAEAEASLTEARQRLLALPREQHEFVAGVYPEIQTTAYLARTRAIQGCLDQAADCVDQALANAESLNHEPTRIWALTTKAWFLRLVGEPLQALPFVDRALALSDQFGLKTRMAAGLMLRGLALVQSGQVEAGLPVLDQGYALWTVAGARCHCSEWAGYAADVLVQAGRHDEALDYVQRGEKIQAQTEEAFFSAELLRLRGRLAWAQGNPGQAKAHCLAALATAEQQGARLFALRAARDHAEFCAAEGAAGEGVLMLQLVLSGFTEGFARADLQLAMRLAEPRAAIVA